MASRTGILGNSENRKGSIGSKVSISVSNVIRSLDPEATTLNIGPAIIDEEEGYHTSSESSGCDIETNNTNNNSIVALSSQMLQWVPFNSKGQQSVTHGGATFSLSPTRNVAGSTSPWIIRNCSNAAQVGHTQTTQNHLCSQSRQSWKQRRKYYDSTDTITRTRSNCVRVIQSNFLTEMHARYPVGYYKVHRSDCDCTKMKQTLSILTSNHNLTTDGGLVVLPDMKNIRNIFFLAPNLEQINPTSDIITNPEYRRNLENLLQKHLFPAEYLPQKKLPPYKVSCASCLLKLENNGFVCVASKDSSTIQSIIQLANQRKEEKMARKFTGIKHQSSLHGDHAFLLLALPRRSLWNIAKENATEFEANIVMQMLLSQVKDITYDDHLSRTYVDTLKEIYYDGEGATNTTFHIGPHLHSMLRMTKSSCAAAAAAGAVQRYNHPRIEDKEKITEQDEDDWWLVMVENKPNLKNNTKRIIWNLDLPGGKRHLGETSLQCAIRETEEETSLVVHETWTKGILKESYNTYYIMTPPS